MSRRISSVQISARKGKRDGERYVIINLEKGSIDHRSNIANVHLEIDGKTYPTEGHLNFKNVDGEKYTYDSTDDQVPGEGEHPNGGKLTVIIHGDRYNNIDYSFY
jgi:hypothetical protein